MNGRVKKGPTPLTVTQAWLIIVEQSVSLHINRDDEDDIMIDTFEARYAVLIGLGVIGSVLGLISIVFLYFARRKF